MNDPHVPPVRGRRYLASVPERLVRASAATVGGAVYEATHVVVPSIVRDTKLYQITLDRMLRITVEGVGGVRGRYPEQEMPVSQLAARKVVGNAVELAGFVAVRWSPLWLLAAASDVVGGSRAYLRALTDDLRTAGVLPDDADVSSYDDLLRRLEAVTGIAADTIDLPPLSIRDARASFEALRQQSRGLPRPDELASIFEALGETARREGRSIGQLSGALGLAAARTGIDLGNVHVFGFYRTALGAIREEGSLRYLRRVASPYLSRAGAHLDSAADTYTDRVARWLERRRNRGAIGTVPPLDPIDSEVTVVESALSRSS